MNDFSDHQRVFRVFPDYFKNYPGMIPQPLGEGSVVAKSFFYGDESLTETEKLELGETRKRLVEMWSRGNK